MSQLTGDDAAANGAVLALVARLPEGAATVGTARDFADQLIIALKPANPEAAECSVKVTKSGTIEMKVGQTRFDVVADSSGPRPVELMAGILEGVIAGRAAESPGRKGGTLRITLYDGKVVRVGEVIGAGLGSRGWRPYAAYGQTDPLDPPKKVRRSTRLGRMLSDLFRNSEPD